MLQFFNFAHYFIELGIVHQVFISFAVFGLSLLVQSMTIGGFDE